MGISCSSLSFSFCSLIWASNFCLASFISSSFLSRSARCFKCPRAVNFPTFSSGFVGSGSDTWAELGGLCSTGCSDGRVSCLTFTGGWTVSSAMADCICSCFILTCVCTDCSAGDGTASGCFFGDGLTIGGSRSGIVSNGAATFSSSSSRKFEGLYGISSSVNLGGATG